MDIDLLVNLTNRAWALPILAKMHQGVPGRQAALLAATGAGRTSFGQSLTHVMALGLLERNPGHGHPLRPEYRLTPKGVHMAELAARVMAVLPDPEDGVLLRKSWTLPVLAVTKQPRRFSEIKLALPGVTDRALSQSLDRLQDHSWIARELDLTERLPRPFYMAHDTGLRVAEAAHRAA